MGYVLEIGDGYRQKADIGRQKPYRIRNQAIFQYADRFESVEANAYLSLPSSWGSARSSLSLFSTYPIVLSQPLRIKIL